MMSNDRLTVYLDDVVENQGKLFDFVASTYPDKDTKHFICSYMRSETRRSIDEGSAYVSTMDAPGLWEYFTTTENYSLKLGDSLAGFLPDWLGEFYAYNQWRFDMPSAVVLEKVPLDFLVVAYQGLHDLDLSLAVEKVGV